MSESFKVKRTVFEVVLVYLITFLLIDICLFFTCVCVCLCAGENLALENDI